MKLAQHFSQQLLLSITFNAEIVVYSLVLFKHFVGINVNEAE